jgi:uncharacterized membrane protein YccF (DUF307 family)
MILLAILLPPMYFLTQKKTGMFILTSGMFVVSLFLALTIVLLPVALILWAIAAIAAVWHNRNKAATEMLASHARKVGAEVAAALQKR